MYLVLAESSDRLEQSRLPNCLVMMLSIFCLPLISYSQTLDNHSSYNVQFIALSDSIDSYSELEEFGPMQITFYKPENVWRYSIGPLWSEMEAQLVLNSLIRTGFRDAFIRENIPDINKEPDLTLIDDIDANVGSEINNKSIMNNEESTVPIAIIEEGINESSRTEDEHIVVQPKQKKHAKSLSFLYTGKSLGVLGSTRYQKEHELITDLAIDRDIPFKLVSHACWRAHGVTVFMPSDEPEGHELELILADTSSWEYLPSLPAIATHNVLLLNDVERDSIDLINLFEEHKLSNALYPESEKIEVDVYRHVIEEDKGCIIVKRKGVRIPSDLKEWRIGEINRIDLQKHSRAYELPYNRGEFGVRAMLLDSLEQQEPKVVKVDMGHRNGDFGVKSLDRSHLDLSGLEVLGYDYIVPYESELSHSQPVLEQLIREFHNTAWLSTNLIVKNDSIIKRFDIIDIDGAQIGLLGFVDPSLEHNLPNKYKSHYEFMDIIDQGQKMVDSLKSMGVQTVVAFSNMGPSDNARLTNHVHGITVLAAEFKNEDGIYTFKKQTEVPEQELGGYNLPIHIAHGRDYGVHIGQLKFTYVDHNSPERLRLQRIEEWHHDISDRGAQQVDLVQSLTENIQVDTAKRGKSLFPAFIDLIDRKPQLQEYDDVTRQGRISKPLWEQFLANVLRNGAPAEVSIIRPVPSFLPLIGKLHEREVRSWLWMQDDVVVMDIKGRDLRRLMESDRSNELITSGISSFKTPLRTFFFVMGRFLREDVFYRVATTNAIVDGNLKEHFVRVIRKKEQFSIKNNKKYKADKSGQELSLRDFTIHELQRLRKSTSGKKHQQKIADLLLPSERYEKLFSLNFVRPTLWTSYNQNFKGEGYAAVPESRVRADDSFIIGLDGTVIIGYDKRKFSLELGTRAAFAQQNATNINGISQTTETMDDLNVNLTYRYKGVNRKKLHPMVRMEYDTEFSATINTESGMTNPRQRILRTIVGLSRQFSMRWPILEMGLTGENDFASGHYQYGVQGRSTTRIPLEKSWHVIYSLTNNLNYYLPTANDTERELSLKYNMIHELLIPLYGEISLSVGADLYLYKGKLEVNRQPGLNMLMKVGITYNRIWKPKFQPLF